MPGQCDTTICSPTLGRDAFVQWRKKVAVDESCRNLDPDRLPLLLDLRPYMSRRSLPAPQRGSAVLNVTAKCCMSESRPERVGHRQEKRQQVHLNSPKPRAAIKRLAESVVALFRGALRMEVHLNSPKPRAAVKRLAESVVALFGNALRTEAPQ